VEPDGAPARRGGVGGASCSGRIVGSAPSSDENPPAPASPGISVGNAASVREVPEARGAKFVRSPHAEQNTALTESSAAQFEQ